MNEQDCFPVNMSLPVTKGSIVRYKDGWMEAKAVFKTTVNLGPIFGSKTTIKKVPLSEVYEDYGEWYAAWEKSESYQCM